MSKKIAAALATAATLTMAQTIQDASAAPGGVSRDAAQHLAAAAVQQAVGTPVVQNAIAAALPDPIAWWKSQAVIGNLVGILLSLVGIVALFQTGNATKEALSVPVGTLVANGVALYGRWTTTRPIAGTDAAARVQNAAG